MALDGTPSFVCFASGQGQPKALGYVVDMGESRRVTIVYEPGEDGSIVASIPEVHSAREKARGEHDRREAEATHST